MTIKEKILLLPSKTDLAEQAGISKSLLSNWLAGRRTISESTEKKIEEAFNQVMKKIWAQTGDITITPIEEVKAGNDLGDEMVREGYKLLVRGTDYMQISKGILYSEKQSNFMAEVISPRGGKNTKLFWTEREARDWRMEELKKLI